jgi:hypothetical protein
MCSLGQTQARKRRDLRVKVIAVRPLSMARVLFMRAPVKRRPVSERRAFTSILTAAEWGRGCLRLLKPASGLG